MTIHNPFKNIRLDAEEKEISKAVEEGKANKISLDDKTRRTYAEAAQFTLNKTKNINIRLSERMLYRLKMKAMEEGIPYQTLVGSILHKYAAG